MIGTGEDGFTGIGNRDQLRGEILGPDTEHAEAGELLEKIRSLVTEADGQL